MLFWLIKYCEGKKNDLYNNNAQNIILFNVLLFKLLSNQIKKYRRVKK